MWSLLLLFFSAFGAATLLPLQSEAVLVGLLLQDHFPAYLLIFIASLGNILGSCINWYLGFYLERHKERRWFPASSHQLEKAQHFYQRYGYWSLLLSWVPIIGDPITLIAGLMKESFLRFLLLVSLAKIGRYVVVYAMTVAII
jgi:membrane protein YqaA with SNARE-associated domain